MKTTREKIVPPILNINDNVENAAILSDALIAEGYRPGDIVTVTTVRDAMAATANSFAAVVVDWKLKDETAEDFIRTYSAAYGKERIVVYSHGEIPDSVREYCSFFIPRLINLEGWASFKPVVEAINTVVEKETASEVRRLHRRWDEFHDVTEQLLEQVNDIAADVKESLSFQRDECKNYRSSIDVRLKAQEDRIEIVSKKPSGLVVTWGGVRKAVVFASGIGTVSGGTVWVLFKDKLATIFKGLMELG